MNYKCKISNQNRLKRNNVISYKFICIGDKREISRLIIGFKFGISNHKILEIYSECEFCFLLLLHMIAF